jgi:hypothetical protein
MNTIACCSIAMSAVLCVNSAEPHLSPTELILSEIQLVAADAAPGDLFGSDVAISGDILLVGAQNAVPGGPYVFVRTQYSWLEQARLTAKDGAALSSIAAISGGTVVVKGSTALHVFVRNGATWIEQAQLTPADGASLGTSLAISGDTVIAGAAPSAYLFVRNGTNWVEQAKLTLPVTPWPPLHTFGGSVALSDDRAVVGAPGHVGSGLNPGAAYVFVREGGDWSFEAELLPDPAAFLPFAGAVAISGNRIVIGSCCGRFEEGTAYVFMRDETTWRFQQALFAGESQNRFGRSVAISGNAIVVGAPLSVRAEAYLFIQDAQDWTRVPFSPADAIGEDRFGTSVAISGGTIAAGAPQTHVAGEQTGAAYVFEFPPAPPLLSLSFHRAERFLVLAWIPRPGRSYTVQSSANLGDWTGLATGITEGEFSTVVPACGMNFFRLIEE